MEKMLHTKILGKRDRERMRNKKMPNIKLFLVRPRTPSKSLLTLQFPKKYEDEVIGMEIINLFKGYFPNKIGHLSRKLYNFILRRYAVKTQIGYITNEKNAGKIHVEVEKLRQEYEELRQQAIDFLEWLIEGGEMPESLKKLLDENQNRKINLDEKYTLKVSEYLDEKYGITLQEAKKKLESINFNDRFKVSIIQLGVDKKAIEEIMDEKAREAVEKGANELYVELISEFKSRVVKILDEVLAAYRKEATVQKINGIKRAMKRLRQQLRDFEVDIFDEELDLIEEMLDKPKETWDAYIERLKLDEYDYEGIRD